MYNYAFCLSKVAAASSLLLPPTVQSKAINPIISNTDISPSSYPRTAAHAPAAFMHLQSHAVAAHAAIQFNIFVSYCQQQHLKYKPHSTKVYF